MIYMGNHSLGKRSKLSPVVRQMGFTESPLPLEEWLKLRQSIRFLLGENGGKRVHLPPAIVSCSRCKKSIQRTAFQLNKHEKRGLTEFYCGSDCACNHFNEKAGKLGSFCLTCGLKNLNHQDRYCSQRCLLEMREKRRAKTRSRYPTCICPQCNTPFVNPWGYKTFCGRKCADAAHAFKMMSTGNPGWRNGMFPLRQQKHSAKAFRLAKPKILEMDRRECAVCDSTKELEVHHISLNPSDNRFSNLVTMCATCHMKLHGGERSKPKKILWPWLSSYASQPMSGTFRSREMKISLRTMCSSTTASLPTI